MKERQVDLNRDSLMSYEGKIGGPKPGWTHEMKVKQMDLNRTNSDRK